MSPTERDRGLGNPSDKRFWNPVAETMPTELIRKVKFEKLQRQIGYCYYNSEFYREKFDALGVRPDDIRTWEDFRNLPTLIDKDEHRRSQEESYARYGHPYSTFLCAPKRDIIAAHGSSGTTGKITFYAYTRYDLDVYNEMCARILWRCGARPGDTAFFGWGLSMWVSSLYIVGMRAMNINPICVGAEGGPGRMLEMIDWMKPRVFIGTPSLAEVLIEKAPQVLGKEVGQLGFETMVLGAEPGGGLPEVRQRLRSAYGARIFDVIGPSSPFAFVSCDTAEYRGMHDCAPDYIIWPEDLVDPTTRKPIEITNGVIGEALMSDVDRRGAPLLKYAYGDLLQVFTDPCPCGLPGMRMKILGRADDMLIVRGVNVYPTAIRNLVNRFIPDVTGNFRIVLAQRPPRVVPPLRIKVEHGSKVAAADVPGLKDRLERACHESLRFRPDIELVEPETLERTLLKGKMFERLYEQ
jgi:phenylacetate-CoA ligase